MLYISRGKNNKHNKKNTKKIKMNTVTIFVLLKFLFLTYTYFKMNVKYLFKHYFFGRKSILSNILCNLFRNISPRNQNNKIKEVSRPILFQSITFMIFVVGKYRNFAGSPPARAYDASACRSHCYITSTP